jgi:hypothetical protein
MWLGTGTSFGASSERDAKRRAAFAYAAAAAAPKRFGQVSSQRVEAFSRRVFGMPTHRGAGQHREEAKVSPIVPALRIDHNFKVSVVRAGAGIRKRHEAPDVGRPRGNVVLEKIPLRARQTMPVQRTDEWVSASTGNLHGRMARTKKRGEQ